MKDKKLRKGLIREWMLLAAALAAVAGVIFLIWHFLPSGKHEDLDAWFGSPAENEAAIVLEDSVYEGKAVLLEDRFFVPYELVQNLLNPRFYWDESVQEMLFTTADTLYEITPESTDYTGNGEKLETESPAVRYVEEQLYVDLDFLQERSDFTYDLLEEPKRVVITMGSQTVTEALLKKDAKIRTGAGIKRTILSDGKKGDAVTVLAVENKWARVRTADGMIGYVKEKTLKDVQEKTRESVYSGPEYTSLSMEGRLNLVWHGIYYEEANDLLEEDTKDMSWVNVISPTWYDLADDEGGVTSFASADYVKQAHKQGLQVWPLISNFGNGSSRAVLGNRASRKKLQEFLIDQARTLDFDGLNIDFEGLAETTGPSYVQFMRELSILCRKEQIYLSVDVAVPMPFSMFYNRKELGVICDYVIMMGYDEHYAGSETAGTVASLNFERTGIANMLKEVAPEKVVSAIPFYTRLWFTGQDADGNTSVTSEVYSMEGAWQVVEENGAVAEWDAEAEQPYAYWTDSEGRLCEIWLEDDATIAARAALVAENNLGGIAAWVLGSEADYVWKVIAENIEA